MIGQSTTAPAFFADIETASGLPGGLLDTYWEFESQRGNPRWMRNPETGAAGHFGILPQNYEPANIDPYDLRQSAEWIAQHSAEGVRRFPGLDPLTAATAMHYGGPDTRIWGPKTTDYVNRVRARFGLEPISNASLVAAAGGDPSRRAGPVEMIPASYSPPAAAPTLVPSGILDIGERPGPLLGEPTRENLLGSPQFWFDLAAGMDPRQAPMAALATGLSNAYSRATERRAAFEESMLRRQERGDAAAMSRLRMRLAEEKLPLERQRIENELERIRIARKQIEKPPLLPSDVRSFKYFADKFGEEKAAAMVSPGGLLPEERGAVKEAEAWGKMRPEYIQQKSDELRSLESSLSETQKLISDFEAGKFKGDVGPVRGLITRYYDPDVAVLQAANISAALQQLSNVNLAPISNYEIQLMQKLYASETRNEAQNIAILKEIRRVQSKKVSALRAAIERLNKGESLQDIFLNPPNMDIDMRYEITPEGIVPRRETTSTVPTEPGAPADTWDDLLRGF